LKSPPSLRQIIIFWQSAYIFIFSNKIIMMYYNLSAYYVRIILYYFSTFFLVIIFSILIYYCLSNIYLYIQIYFASCLKNCKPFVSLLEVKCKPDDKWFHNYAMLYYVVIYYGLIKNMNKFW
jgi:hypothetical protein